MYVGTGVILLSFSVVIATGCATSTNLVFFWHFPSVPNVQYEQVHGHSISLHISTNVPGGGHVHGGVAPYCSYPIIF